MKIIYLLLFLLSLSLGNVVQAKQPPNDIEVSLLTASPGEKLYSVFGHNALRIKNKTTGLDIVFNYGMFSFNEPDFYLNFVRGRMNYWLGTESYSDFYFSYTSENRGIQEQIFEMDSIQKQFVVHFLEINLKVENRYYPYHFFEDNCATRIRDLVLLTYNGIEFPITKEEITYRELVHKYLKNRSWTKLGIDLVLGVSADKKTNVYEQMFLPDYLFNALAETEYNERPVIKETITVFVPEQSKKQTSFSISPLFIFCCIFIVSLLFCFIKKGAEIFDFTLFLIVGFLGTVISLLWFFNNHTDMQNNFNIMWAFPAHLVMAFFMLFKKHSKFDRIYFLATFIMSTLLLISWAIIPQELNPVLIPLIISISLRSLWNSFSIRYR